MFKRTTASLQRSAEVRSTTAPAGLGLSPELLQTVVGTLPTPLAILLGKDYLYVFANRSHRDWFLAGRDPVGKTALQMVPEAAEQGFFQLLDQVFATGEPFTGKEASLVLHQQDGPGRRLYFDFSYHPWRDASGQIIGIVATASDVTEHRTERETAESVQRALAADRDNLRRMFADSEHFFISWRAPNFVYEVSNPVSDRIVGCRALGRRLCDVVPNAGDSGLIDLLERVVETGEPTFVAEFAVLLAGERRFFEATYIARKNAMGQIDGVMALGLDITQRVRERHKLKESQRDLSRAVSVARVGFYDWDVQKDAIEVSELFALMYQVERTTTLEAIFAVVHPDDRAKIRQKVDRALQTGGRYHEHHRLRRSDDSVIWVEAIGEVTFDANGRPARFFGTIRDITDVKEASRSLALQQHLNESILAQSPAGIALLRGPELVLEKCNGSWAQFAPAAAGVGQSVADRLIGADGTDHRAEVYGVLRTARPLQLREVRGLVSTGGGQPACGFFDLTASQIRDGAGAPFGVVCQANDVTENVLAREQLEENLTELHAERELRDRFVATLTHDMRTPLTAAKMSADQLTRKQRDSATTKRLGERIVRCIGRAEAMVQNLLDANRLKAGEQLHIKLEPCSLDALVEQSIEELSAIHRRDFVLEVADTPVRAYVDKDAIRRILDNLGGNAVKYGDARAPIVIGLREVDEHLELMVHNEGPAISPADQKTLFDAYSRSDAAVQSGQKGWGIGLSLVKGLAEAHGGQVAVHSAIGHGTTFRLTLPKN